MKRKIYIALFSFFGFLIQLLLHAGIEMGYISLLKANFDKYSLGF